MIGPLWGFFKLIRNKGTKPLAIDQYSYMVEALYQIDPKSLTSPSDLLNFTKIFWLNDVSYVEQYEAYFRSFFDLEEFIFPPEPKPAIDDSTTQKNDAKKEDVVLPENRQEGQKEDAGDGEEGKDQSVYDHLVEDDLVDFELVLRDSDVDLETDKSIILPIGDFIMHDNSMMPFEVRNFAQRLRRKVETVEQVTSDVIDIDTMIEQFCGNGFIEEIKYKFEDTSHSKIVLFSDRFGSMLAYEFLDHHFRAGFNQIPYCKFEHFYFRNLPEKSADREHYKMQRDGSGTFLNNTADSSWDANTWFFILSDAGGHSGMVHNGRLRATLKFYDYIKNISEHVHWINPVPFEFLNDCTARRLQMAIPMTYPDTKGLNEMIQQSKNSS